VRKELDRKEHVETLKNINQSQLESSMMKIRKSPSPYKTPPRKGYY